MTPVETQPAPLSPAPGVAVAREADAPISVGMREYSDRVAKMELELAELRARLQRVASRHQGKA